jgi:hypothetical protein
MERERRERGHFSWLGHQTGWEANSRSPLKVIPCFSLKEFERLNASRRQGQRRDIEGKSEKGEKRREVERERERL